MMKPSDCVLAFGVPISDDDFFEAAKHPDSRDFVRNVTFAQYRLEVISHIEKLLPYFTRLGVHIVPRLRLEDLRDLMDSNPNKAIILFSHWRDDSIEFHDGMAASDDVISQVPNIFTGIVDLCVCHPTTLARKLRDHLPPTALIKFSDKVNTPYKWLYFYWGVFTILNDSNVSYVEALRKCVRGFIQIR